MEKKYEITKETMKAIDENGDEKTLHRIKALKDFGNVKKGDFGGFVENESNLSQEGSCWIFDDAICCSNAIVYENAILCENAFVYGNVKIGGNSLINDEPLVRLMYFLSDIFATLKSRINSNKSSEL